MMQMYEVVYHEYEFNSKMEAICRWHKVVSEPVTAPEAYKIMQKIRASCIYRPKAHDSVTMRKTKANHYNTATCDKYEVPLKCFFNKEVKRP